MNLTVCPNLNNSKKQFYLQDFTLKKTTRKRTTTLIKLKFILTKKERF